MSIPVPTRGFGGGSNSLNLKVIGYASEELRNAAKPKENTIGVITDKDIPGYYFSATQPEDMTEGQVWIFTGESSPVAFSVLKKNTVMVYPLVAKQYVSGGLVEVNANSYQNGAWVDWITYTRLISGGTIGYEYTLKVGSTHSAVLTQNSDSISLSSTGELYHGIAFPNIPLQEHQSKLCIKGTFSGNYSRLCVWSAATTSPGEGNVIACVDVSGSGGELDVSNLTKGNEYIFGFTHRHPNTEIISDLWLE